LSGTVRTDSRVVKLSALWQTQGMTNQQTNQQQCPQYREDLKVQKLAERLDKKLAFQAKAVREATQAKSKN
jgi:deoxyhypusine synthase